MNCIKPYILDGFIFVDGVKLGKPISCEGEPAIELCDKNRHQSSRRGTRLVIIRVADLIKLFNTDEPPDVLKKRTP
jgi:hypothetical protein